VASLSCLKQRRGIAHRHVAYRPWPFARPGVIKFCPTLSKFSGERGRRGVTHASVEKYRLDRDRLAAKRSIVCYLMAAQDAVRFRA
jgi:hypothetical protein